MSYSQESEGKVKGNFSSSTPYNRYDSQGKRHGLWLFYDEDSTFVKTKGTFEHGEEVDTFFYYVSTVPHPVCVRAYQKKGVCYTQFFDSENRIMSEGTYVDRKKDGLWKYYDIAGYVLTTEQYEDGILNGDAYVYYEDSTVTERSSYINGELHGTYERFTEDGKKMERLTYWRGQRHGIAEFYNTNGGIFIKGIYRNGLKDSLWTYYNGYGDITRQEDYSPAGRKKKRMSYDKKNKKRGQKKDEPAQEVIDINSFLDSLEQKSSTKENLP